MSERDSSATSPELGCPQCGRTFGDGLRFCPDDGAKLVPSRELARPASAEGVSTRKAPPSMVGTVLAERYRLLRKIGEGGMGEVYEAQHVYIDKRVAIKTLRREILANPEATLRFQQEARAASTIGHENIVAIDDFGQLPDGGVYMAMEYLEGLSLAERARQGALSRGEILDVMVQVCRGLAAAHDKGIIHRDMKPENVFLARRGDRLLVKILDFGIAKVNRGAGGATSSPQLTQTGAVFGTPFYMSPEQALGKPLDARTDVYSVGVMLYELFAGRVPFEGDSFMAILSQHITTQPLPPSRVAPRDRPVPPSFERLILKAMAKEREQRFATMAALGDALVEAERRSAAETLEGLGPEGPPVELAELPKNHLVEEEQGGVALDEAPPPSRSRLLVWGLLGAMIVLGAAGGTVSVLRSGGSSSRTSAAATTGGAATTPSSTVTPTTAGAPDPRGGETGATTEVVLDSQPGGAKVFAGGNLIAETPDTVRVPVGRTLEVLIHKEGYTPRQVTIDPARDGRKVIVRLERAKNGRAPGTPAVDLPRLPSGPSGIGTPAPTPAPSPVVPPPTPITPPPAPRATPRPTTSPTPGDGDLYAPMPPPTRKPAAPTPARRPPPPAAPLDPYAN